VTGLNAQSVGSGCMKIAEFSPKTCIHNGCNKYSWNMYEKYKGVRWSLIVI
jgi:hypothetical protein